ncbi:MAG: sulfotransferase [Gemmobacter sp.]|nr:sulfotransferase [Gemmobacter sp.]
MSGEPTVLICAGATKAGTSWLYDHLRMHPDCHLRSIKELHYFDMQHHRNFDRYLAGLTRRAAALTAERAGAPARAAARLDRKLADVAEWRAVVDLRADDLQAYRNYLLGGHAGQALVADLTPGYAPLPEDRFRQMAELGADVRFVYLLRDPVSRLWSQMRMTARRQVADIADYPRRALMLMRQAIRDIAGGKTDREDYAGTITRMQAVIAPQRLMVMFQDDMLTAAGLARLWSFLGIGAGQADFGRRVLEGVSLPLPPRLQAKALAVLRPQYDFVARLFPALPESWRKTLNEVHA